RKTATPAASTVSDVAAEATWRRGRGAGHKKCQAIGTDQVGAARVAHAANHIRNPKRKADLEVIRRDRSMVEVCRPGRVLLAARGQPGAMVGGVVSRSA